MPSKKEDERKLKDQPKKKEQNEANRNMNRNMRGPAITVQPIHPASSGPVSEVHPANEDSIDSFLAQSDTAIARPTLPRTSFPMHPMHPAHELPGNDASRTTDSMVPMTLNRPRKLSNSSTATASTMYSQNSLASGLRSSSWGSRTSVESAESTQWRPEYLRQIPMPVKKQLTVKARKPNEVFATLPGEVLEHILVKLRDSHLGSGSHSCATCWMRDVSSVCLASRKWSTVARPAL